MTPDAFAAFPRVMIARMDSARFLRAIVPADLPPALFFLDAHFAPGADYGLADYAEKDDPRLRFPLRGELEILRARRNGRESAAEPVAVPSLVAGA